MKENVCTLFWVLRESINCNKADYLPISFLFVFLWVYSEFSLAITSLRFGCSQTVTPLQSLKITRRCNNHLSEKSLSYIINYCHKLEFKRENKPKVALTRTRNIFDNSGGRSNHYHRLMRKETHFYFLSTWEVFFPHTEIILCMNCPYQNLTKNVIIHLISRSWSLPSKSFFYQDLLKTITLKMIIKKTKLREVLFYFPW